MIVSEMATAAALGLLRLRDDQASELFATLRPNAEQRQHLIALAEAFQRLCREREAMVERARAAARSPKIGRPRLPDDKLSPSGRSKRKSRGIA